jgi:MtN3 and saliva related transmembrane protein
VESTTLLGVATTAWGVVMSVAPILQIRRIRAAGTSAGVSRGHLLVLLVGFSLWLAYGIAIDLLPLVITNAVSLVATGAWLVEVRRFRQRTDPMIAT